MGYMTEDSGNDNTVGRVENVGLMVDTCTLRVGWIRLDIVGIRLLVPS